MTRVIGSVRLPELPDGRDQVLWPRLLDLTEALTVPHVLVGGLMVYLHGAVAGRARPRPDREIEVLADLRSASADLPAVLGALGYEPDEVRPGRYSRGDGIPVTVRALERVKPKPPARKAPPVPVATVPGGTTVLADPVAVRAEYGPRAAQLFLPDLARALFATARGYLVDHEPHRVADVAYLVSLTEDPAKVLDELGASRSAERFEFLAELDDPAHTAWLDLGAHGESAHRTWERLRRD
ncbi:hypothetical protein GCM10010174_62200 [Kutzneria viridogrisea]|uniref:Uncharacterized protein n=2 Tax=Kutzneria TaxID=43356 RepID=W5WRA4_9PSEU|nr:hypothetical protein [Kutzneria albida]AHI00690.1 hypothetical protein KALB_7332 [Kutzneria albida DSM 43870]MBA8925869.1 hypothetical protein [Kutzneria viridogrisea]